ncbi:MAG TPA: PAS domain S-box protein [Thermoanaerobaculia bacterium]
MTAHADYHELVVNAPDGIVVVSNGRVMFANDAAAALVGLPNANALVGHTVLDFVSSHERERIVALIQQLYVDRKPASLYEVEVVRAAGERRTVELMARPTIYDGTNASIVFIRDITDRKRTENALAASEARYARVVESMNEVLIVHDADGNIEFVNDRFCRLFRLRRDEVTGKAPEAVFAPETAGLVRRGLERRRSGMQDRFEAPLVAKNGVAIDAQISAAPLLRDGRFDGSVALIADLSARTIAEQALHKSEQRYRELIDSLPHFIVSFDVDDRYTAANETTCRYLGLREDEVVGRTFEEVGIAPETAREFRVQMARVRSSGRRETMEATITIRNGPLKIVQRTLSPIYDNDGAVIGISVISVDVTEQRRSAERNDELLRAVEEMHEIMFTTDAAGVITYVNPSFERVYGYSRDEAIGRTPRLIKSGETPPRVYEEFWREVQQGRTVRTEFANRRKDGQLVRVSATISPMHGEGGRLAGYTAVQRDITEEWKAALQKRELEQQIAHAATMQSLGTLAGGLAHDFNNILSIVLTHATVVELSLAHRERVLRAIETIKSAVNRGSSLSRQILTFARKTDVRFSNIDINPLAMEIGSMVREMFPRTIQIELDLAASLPAVRGDSDQLHQAMLNLCLNARDAMPNGGTLRIATALNDDCVSIVVSDTGCGMTPETMSRMFEPFFTTKGVGKGTGLGLAVVYGVAKAHDGRVSATSEHGRGSSFRFSIPIGTPQSERETPRGGDAVQGHGEKILMIEDEAEIRNALAGQLRVNDYEIIEAGSADEARDALRRHSDIAVIVSDLGIPDQSSRELVAMLRAEAPQVPLIPMTGYVDPDLHRDVLAAGTQRVLQKPFTIDQLLVAIRDVLAAPVGS